MSCDPIIYITFYFSERCWQFYFLLKDLTLILLGTYEIIMK